MKHLKHFESKLSEFYREITNDEYWVNKQTISPKHRELIKEMIPTSSDEIGRNWEEYWDRIGSIETPKGRVISHVSNAEETKSHPTDRFYSNYINITPGNKESYGIRYGADDYWYIIGY